MNAQELLLQEEIKKLSAFSSSNHMEFAYLLLETDETYHSCVQSNQIDSVQQEQYRNMIDLIIAKKWELFPPEKRSELINTLKEQCINNPNYMNGSVLNVFVNKYSKVIGAGSKTGSGSNVSHEMNSQTKEEFMKPKGPGKRSLFLVLAGIVLIAILCFVVPNFTSPSSSTTTHKGSSRTESLDNYIEQKHAEEAAEDEEETLTPVTEPANGAILYGTESGDSSITVTASSRPCVVKLLDANQNDVVAFYVAANSTATIAVPATDLYVHFAEGTTWYGYDNLFGKDTQFSAQEDPLFSETLDFYEYTYTFELYLQDNGNFEPIDIPKESF